MPSRDNSATLVGDPLGMAVEQLFNAAPEFAVNPTLSEEHIDLSNPHMIFEAFARFLLQRMKEKGVDDCVRDGVQFLSELVTRSPGEVANLVGVSVLEHFADEGSMHELIGSLLEGEARRAFEGMTNGGL